MCRGSRPTDLLLVGLLVAGTFPLAVDIAVPGRVAVAAGYHLAYRAIVVGVDCPVEWMVWCAERKHRGRAYALPLCRYRLI